MDTVALTPKQAIGQKKRIWIYVFLFTLTQINYIDRVSL